MPAWRVGGRTCHLVQNMPEVPTAAIASASRSGIGRVAALRRKPASDPVASQDAPPSVPGIAGLWLRVLVITAAFDVTHRISWRPHWQTGLRALAALGVSVLIDYPTALKADAAKAAWTLLMAMNFGAFQTMFLMDR